MKGIQELSHIVNTLKNHVDCLLIRVSSCQQFIQRLFKIVGQSSINEKCYSAYDYACKTSPSSPEINTKKKLSTKQLQQIVQLHTNAQSQAQRKSYSSKIPSINEFVIFPTSKQTKRQQAENGSFIILKNLIMVHNHEIQKLQEKFDQISTQSQTKYNKSSSAIELLTKVIGMLQEKVQFLWELSVMRKRVTSRSSVKNKSIIDNYKSF